MNTMPRLQITGWFDLARICANSCKIIFAYYNIQSVYDNMRSSVKIRFFIILLFAVTLHIFLYFAKQGHIPDYIVYIMFAITSVPMFLFAYLGYNKND